jgi:hypothetical protein
MFIRRCRKQIQSIPVNPFLIEFDQEKPETDAAKLLGVVFKAQ